MGSPYCSEKSLSALTLVTLRTAVGMKLVSSQSEGKTPMPGCGLLLTLWNMPRISAVASTGAWRVAIQPAVLQAPSGARSTTASAPAGAPFLLTDACTLLACADVAFKEASRTKKPRFLCATTRPCASNWSYAATTVETLTPCCSAHSRTEGRRAPGASRRLRMRSANRAESCSVSDWEAAFINMVCPSWGLAHRGRRAVC